MPGKPSKFKERKMRIDEKHAPIERDLFYWIETVAHWHLILIGLITLFACAYFFFDQHASVFARGL